MCSGLFAMLAIASTMFDGRPLSGVVVAERRAEQPSGEVVQAASALDREMNAACVDV